MSDLTKKLDKPILIKFMILHPKDNKQAIVTELNMSKTFYNKLEDKEKFIGKEATKLIDTLLRKEEEIKNEQS